MKKILVAFACLLNIGAASAATIDFEDFAGAIVNPFTDFPAIGNNYAGLDWNNGNNISAVNINPFLSPGVDYTGLNNISIFNDFGQSPSYIDIAGTGTFDFNQGYWSSQQGASTVQFEGWFNGVKIHDSAIFDINSTSVLLVSLNWSGIDRLVINSTSLWIADNFDVNINPSAVPAPAAIWLFGSAILGFGLRRKTI